MDIAIRMYGEWLGYEIVELNVQVNHVYVAVSIPPKVSVSTYMGTLKGKTAIKVFKSYPMLRKRPYWGNRFWARGYFVNSVGINEDLIRSHIKYQEGEELKEGGTSSASASTLELSLWLHP